MGSLWALRLPPVLSDFPTAAQQFLATAWLIDNYYTGYACWKWHFDMYIIVCVYTCNIGLFVYICNHITNSRCIMVWDGASPFSFPVAIPKRSYSAQCLKILSVTHPDYLSIVRRASTAPPDTLKTLQNFLLQPFSWLFDAFCTAWTLRSTPIYSHHIRILEIYCMYWARGGGNHMFVAVGITPLIHQGKAREVISCRGCRSNRSADHPYLSTWD